MPVACISAYAVVGADEPEPAPLERLGQRHGLRRARRHLGERGRAGAGRGGGANDQSSAASPSGSSAAARALAIAASILARLRTMPASASSRSTSASPNAATVSMSKPANAAPERGPLAQDRQPGQPGLERLEGEPLVERRRRRGPAGPTPCRDRPRSPACEPPHAQRASPSAPITRSGHGSETSRVPRRAASRSPTAARRSRQARPASTSRAKRRSASVRLTLEPGQSTGQATRPAAPAGRWNHSCQTTWVRPARQRGAAQDARGRAAPCRSARPGPRTAGRP